MVYERFMRSILFVISSLDYGGAARQLSLLASGLARDSFRVRVAVLGAETPWVSGLRSEGVEVEVLNRRRVFDVLPFARLRRLARLGKPDIVHAWGATALRALALSGSQSPSRLFLSSAFSFVEKTTPLDRWLLRRVRGAIAFGEAEAARYRRLGVADARLTVVAPGMPLPEPIVAPAALPGIADHERVLVGLGPIERHKGFREAVWAFDILAHFYDDVHLVLAGDGTDRPRVERFARQIGVRSRVHFLGPQAELSSLLQRADAVWVPSLRGGGVCATLEAMAASRPVIASHLPDLAEIVDEGQTGFLVEPDDKAALARRTRRLLDDAELRRRMGEAGRRRIRDCFSVVRLVESCIRRYAELVR